MEPTVEPPQETANSDAWWSGQPLLSELQSSFLKCFIRYPRSIPAAAGTVFLATVMILLLGHYSGANVLGLRTEVNLWAGSGDSTTPLSLTDLPPALAGYLANVIHGLFFLTIAPLSVYLSLRFVMRLNRILRELSAERLLVPKDTADLARFERPEERIDGGELNREFLAEVGRKNGKVFRVVVPSLIFLLIAFNAWRELASWEDPATVNGGTRSFGSMQSQFFPLWVGEFESRSPAEKIEKLQSLETWGKIKQEIAIEVRRNKGLRDAWAAAGLIRHRGIPIDSANFLEYAEGPTLVKNVAFEDALAKQYWTVKVKKSAGGNLPERRLVFYLFFGLVLVMEGGFHAFAIWLLLKFVFWLMLVHRLLPTSKYSMELVPFLQDKGMQCGLGKIHATYNFIVIASGIAVIAYLLHRKGNDPNLNAGTSQFEISVIIGSCVLVVISILFLLPFFLNRLKIRPSIMEAEAEMNRQIGAEGNPELRNILREKLELIRSQKTWPVGDKKFLSCITVIGLAIVAPWLPEAIPAPLAEVFKPVVKLLDLAEMADQFTRWISVRFYKA